MKPETMKAICEAHLEVENEYGIVITEETTRAILSYCIHKLKRIGKEEDYLPLLYRCELPLQLAMQEINRISENRLKERKKGVEEYVFGMLSDTLQPKMPQRT